MNARKIIFNIFVFSILIGSFFYYYINSNTIARAEELRLCVKGEIIKDPNTGKDDYSRLDFTKYITITYPNYSCPSGYAMMPAGFNLNLLNYIPPTSNFLGGGNSSTSSTSSNTGNGQNNPPYDPNNPYSDLYNELNNYLNNGNNGNGSNYGDGNYGNGSNYGDSSNYGNGNYGNGSNYGDGSNYGNGNYGNGSNYGDASGDSGLGDILGSGNIFNNPNYGNGTSGSGSGNNSSDPYKVNPNPIIQIDPKLATGRFEALDPNDYKYCVLLTKNMSIGANDINTGKEVSALQMYLYDRGYLDAPANGNYDQNTALAVAKFQYRNQIEVSGIVKADLREILKELTCIKYPVISYVAKPISPAPATVKITPTSSTNNSNSTPKVPAKPTPTPSKPTTPIITLPPTINDSNTEDSTIKGSLSQVEGNMYLSKGNILYFAYNTKSTKSFICLSLNDTDCSNPGNYAVLDDGVMMNLYEVVKLSNFWAFSLYNSQIWGAPGDKARIYLKDNLNSSYSVIYIINILN